MSARSIATNIAGRVQKIKTKDFLIPLFEAISNSIHAIEAVRAPNGKIDVCLLREPRQAEIKTDEGMHESPITGFIVVDNGIGFDEANMDSFCEADSTFKDKLGGKGIGRFSWLKFFEKADVESVFQNGEKRVRRSFTFTTSGIDEKELVEVKPETQLRTEVKIAPLHITLEHKTCKSLDQIAIELVEHFIAYLVTESMPSLTVTDGAKKVDIDAMYKQSIGKHSARAQFLINDQVFMATTFRFYLGAAAHTAFLCGDKRVAERFQLGKRDPFFAKRFTDDDLKQYAFHMFVQSDYLNRIVNDDRDGFSFPEAGTLEGTSSGSVTREALVEKILAIARKEMEQEIDAIKKSNLATITTFVSDNAPQYRRLIARHADAVAAIHETDKFRIDQALRRMQFEEELETRREINTLLHSAEAATDTIKEQWTKKSAAILAKLNEEGKANLASYIVQRKMILELLQKRMEIEGESHAREDAIHELIFPMRKTSDDVGYEEQNLWIIDERLAYHYYLASDKPLMTMPPADTDSKKEPDIIVFNRPIALNDRPESERLEAITIVEFKRPGEGSVEGQKIQWIKYSNTSNLFKRAGQRREKGGQ